MESNYHFSPARESHYHYKMAWVLELPRNEIIDCVWFTQPQFRKLIPGSVAFHNNMQYCASEGKEADFDFVELRQRGKCHVRVLKQPYITNG